MSAFNLNLGDFNLSYCDSNTIRFEHGDYHILVKPVLNGFLEKCEFKIELYYKNNKCSKEFESLDYALAYMYSLGNDDKGIV